MFCVTWTCQTPPSLSKPAMDKLLSEVARRYLGVPGLVRKYFGYSEDGKQAIGVVSVEKEVGGRRLLHGRMAGRRDAAPGRDADEDRVVRAGRGGDQAGQAGHRLSDPALQQLASSLER